MSISKMILPEFEHEMASTRKTLERVPDDKFSWKPHEKSMTLGGLATHLSNIPSWTAMTFDRDELDISPNGEPYRLEEAKSRTELLEAFDQNVASARAALEAAHDENWQGKGSLLMTGKPICTLLGTGLMGGFVMNHLINNGAGLGVYLGFLVIQLPWIFGLSGAEGGF